MISHIPVLLDEVVAALDPKPGRTIVDGTFGRGGYTLGIVTAAGCRLIAIDRDPAAIRAGAAMGLPATVTLVAGCFGEMRALLMGLGIEQVDGVVLDLGVSSPQLDEADRGFSFMRDGPLDMRMGASGETAADLVNRLDEAELANILWTLGDERFSRKIAAAIVRARAIEPIDSTEALARLVRAVVPAKKDGIHPATRTFQALRIRVNDELGELSRGLEAAEQVLRPGGRLAVVTFHSLEDRILKGFLRDRSGAAPSGSRHLPPMEQQRAPSFRLIGRRAITAGAAELDRNPRARSAKLRVAERTGAPNWPPSSGPSSGEGRLGA